MHLLQRQNQKNRKKKTDKEKLPQKEQSQSNGTEKTTQEVVPNQKDNPEKEAPNGVKIDKTKKIEKKSKEVRKRDPTYYCAPPVYMPDDEEELNELKDLDSDLKVQKNTKSSLNFLNYKKKEVQKNEL